MKHKLILERLWLIGTVIFGLAAAKVPVLVTLTWAGLIVYSASGLTKGNKYRIWQAVVASPFMEIWGRMTRAPGVPIEMGKYFILYAILLLTVSWLKEGKRPSLYFAGLFLFIALLPSNIFALANLPFDYEDWVFNTAGILSIAFILLFSAKERWDEQQLRSSLKFAAMFVVYILIALTLNGKGIAEETFDTGARGFAPNQVSTVLGAAFLMILIPMALKRPLFKPVIINYLLLGYILLQGLFTFSRGGMVVAVISAIVLFTPVIFQSKRNMVKSILVACVMIVGGAGVFYYANQVSGDHLVQRYKGETKGTLNGDKEKNINTLTNGRFSIANTDLLIFIDNPLFGVGPGQARYLREKYEGFNVVAHVEFTRLLSENGVGGAVAALILIFFAVWYVIKIKSNVGKRIAAALFTLAILTTFHNAMRTNTTVVFYVLGAMPIQYQVRKRALKFENNPEFDIVLEES